MYKMKITTSNECQNGGGFHEIHTSNFLSSPEHCFATLDSIIKNNLAFNCYDSTLKKVLVESTNRDVVEYVSNSEMAKQYKRFCDVDIDVSLVFEFC